MSQRALTREPSDYVVRFLTDGSVMVRQKVHIVADSRIRLNEIYPVRWGENDKDTCDAIILAAGDYIAISAKAEAARKDERFVLASTSDETVVTSNPPEDAQSYCSEPSQASPSPPPPQRRRVGPAHSTPRVTPVRPRATRSKTIRTLTKSGKPAVRVIKVVTPHDFHEPLPTIRRPKQRKRVRHTPQQSPRPLQLYQLSHQHQCRRLHHLDLPFRPTSLDQSPQQWQPLVLQWYLSRGPAIPWTGSSIQS